MPFMLNFGPKVKHGWQIATLQCRVKIWFLCQQIKVLISLIATVINTFK